MSLARRLLLAAATVWVSCVDLSGPRSVQRQDGGGTDSAPVSLPDSKPSDAPAGTTADAATAPDTATPVMDSGGDGGTADTSAPCEDGCACTMHANCAAGFACVNSACRSLSAGLVGLWRMNEGSGTTASDTSSYKNTATLKNSKPSSWVAGRSGTSALDFDGALWLDVADAPSLDVSTELTVAAWVNRPSGSMGLEVVLHRGASSNPSEDHVLFGFISGRPTLHGKDIGSVTGGAALPTAAWKHVAATYKSGTMILYVDGVAVSVRVAGAGVALPDTTPLTIGAEHNTADQNVIENAAFVRLSDLGLWNRALSAAEIGALAAGRAPR